MEQSMTGAGERPAGAGPAAVPSEEDLLFALVRARYGDRLTPEELDALRATVAGVVEGVREVRAVPLRNAQGPLPPTGPDPLPPP
jgi:hypothetical protein